jgi:membrane protein DedA with SNARE-associated domain
MGILASGVPAAVAPLPGFLNSVAGPVEHYGYWAIALLLLLENIGIPVIPGELAMITGAIFAGTGRAGLNVVGVGIVAVTAAIIGAEIGYLVGRFAGRELILRYGRYVFIKPHHLERAEAIVDRYGGIVVVIARFIVGLREANGIIAGISQMRVATFTFFNVIGAFAWVATWVTLGYAAGDHIDTIYTDVNRYALYLLLTLVVALVSYVGWRLVRRRLQADENPEAPEPPSTQKPPGAQKPPEAQESLAAHQESLAAHQESPAAHQETPAAHQEAPAAQESRGIQESS